MADAPVNYCSHCGAKVTTLKARFCKACGAALAGKAPAQIVAPQPVVVELTDKKWKRMQEWGKAIRLLGIMLLIVSLVAGASTWFCIFSGAICIVGATVLGHANYQIWWHHG